ncbi:MAG: GGDEF domain-containing protein [Candidatus Gracilibacteria bacterium]|nr:GGDEF domain-containing protein [Candidatus Gracilibacteria bacterium]
MNVNASSSGYNGQRGVYQVNTTPLGFNYRDNTSGRICGIVTGFPSVSGMMTGYHPEAPIIEARVRAEEAEARSEEISRQNAELEGKITKIVGSMKDAIRLANTDELTGVGNRKAFFALLENRLGDRRSCLIVALFDIDHFKRINDDFGHPFGDMVLRELSAFIKTNLREEDKLFRIGGEEFAIIFGPRGDINGIIKHLEEVCKSFLKKEFIESGKSTKGVGISVGIQEFSVPQVNKETNPREHVYSIVDRLMYHSKEDGRKRLTYVPLGGEITTIPYDN